MPLSPTQIPLPFPEAVARSVNPTINRLLDSDRAFHDWYRFVLSYPPHLVRRYIEQFHLDIGQTILDPFCGTGTTPVEARLYRFNAVGLEANSMSWLASRTKTDWAINPAHLRTLGREIADDAKDQFQQSSTARLRLDSEQHSLLLQGSISPLPLHKSLLLLESIQRRAGLPGYDHCRLALAKTLVSTASNLRFGPEVGIGKIIEDAPVFEAWLDVIQSMCADLEIVSEQSHSLVRIYQGDARQASRLLEPGSIDAVITSPPYPNEKDYTRTTRLESVVLGLIQTKVDLRSLKHSLLRSNTRGVYKGDADDRWVTHNQRVQQLAADIEARRIELGKTSGFERLYSRVTLLYFGGMARHLDDLKRVLRPGAKLAYVVGDQASFFRIHIKTGELLAEIAEQHGYRVLGIDLFRTRFSTATKQQLREEVLLLEWNP